MAKPVFLEAKLAPWFTKKAPWQISADGRANIVKLLPWLDFALLIFLLPAVLAILALGSLIGGFATAAGISTGPLYWISLILLFIQTVFMAVAIAPLYRRQRKGWVLLYYGTLFGLASDLFDWVNTPAAVFGLVWGLLIAVLSLYIIFQVRDHYK
jgi:hypothetical protein